MTHGHSEPHDPLDFTGMRLRLVGSRLVTDGKGHVRGHDDDTESLLPGANVRGGPGGSVEKPKFLKNAAATHFELFYDLWFVANLSVFSTVHDISDEMTLFSYMGYITLLWTTWLLTTIYDVRYTTDSVFERCARAIHLGTMIGFAEIGTSFNPDKQVGPVFKAMSLFLMVSRLALTIQYTVVLIQVRKYKDGRLPIALTAFLHLASAMVYFGISFRWEPDKQSSRVFVVWYALGILEMAVHLGFSQLSSVLSFVHTHLGERLNLLTLIILGEGVIILAKNVTLLVKDTYVKDPTLIMWSSSLIGIVTCSTALIYIIFQLYFDYMHEDYEEAMFVKHQVWWAALHLPFHITLVLALEGAGQFMLWARVLESVTTAVYKLSSISKKVPINATGKDYAKELTKLSSEYLEKYQPKDVLKISKHVNNTIDEMSKIPDSFFRMSPQDRENSVYWDTWNDGANEVLFTLVNSVYSFFGFEAPDDDKKDAFKDLDTAQQQVAGLVGIRFRLVFIYTFACAGSVLLFLSVFHLLSKRQGWSVFNIIRTSIAMFLAIGLGLVPILSINEDILEYFTTSPWMLPTITITYFVVLVVSHLPHPRWKPLTKARQSRMYSQVDVNNFQDEFQLRPVSVASTSQFEFDNQGEFKPLSTEYSSSTREVYPLASPPMDNRPYHDVTSPPASAGLLSPDPTQHQDMSEPFHPGGGGGVDARRNLEH